MLDIFVLIVGERDSYRVVMRSDTEDISYYQVIKFILQETLFFIT